MIAIISDVHANYPALAAVLNKIDQLDVSRIICLGDTAGYYSQINECCNELRERDIFTLQGNHDWYLYSGSDCPRSNSATAVIQFQSRIIVSENLQWLGGLPSKARIDGISAVHGGWSDPLEEYVRPSATYFEMIEGEVFVSGHTHHATLWRSGNKQYCNPGSVGQPRDGDWRAAFATWDGESFTLFRVEYDFRETQFHMQKQGFPEFFWRNLEYGIRIGANPAS